jgi:hypothetical protein
MYQVLEKAVGWLLVSSADPSSVSLTIRGMLIGIAPATIAVLNLAHINLGQDQLTALVDGFVNLLQAVLTVISMAITFYGAVRKVWNTSFPKYAF